MSLPGQPGTAPAAGHVPSNVRVEFAEPVQAIVPGQYAVLYAGDRVLGGGVIRQVRDAQRRAELPLIKTQTPSASTNARDMLTVDTSNTSQ
jgi:hypothetical protein